MEKFRIEKWGRFFALYEDSELLCVAVYKKGAMAVLNRIRELKRLVEGEDETEGFIPRDGE